MGLKVGEMFVDLGIQGSEKTVDAVGSLQKGMGGLKGMSLEAKAAILAAFYAIGKLVSESGSVGTGLKNFNALTNMSTKSLQQYQYAMRQAGGTNEEVTKTFESLQKTMQKMAAGQGAPGGLALMFATLNKGGMKINPAEALTYKDNTELLFKRLQQYANMEKNAAARSFVLSSFGISDNMMAAMARNMFRPDILNKAPAYTDAQIAQLDRANIAWKNMGVNIEMAFGKFNAAHGPQLANDIAKIADAVIKLTDALVRLSERAGTFKEIERMAKAAADMTGGLADSMDKLNKKGIVGGMKDESVSDKAALKSLINDLSYFMKTGQRPHVINQSLNFQHDGKDHSKVADSHKKAAQQAHQNLPRSQSN